MTGAVVKVTSKGQLTIPVDIRKELDINEGDCLYVTRIGDLILMKRVDVDPKEILNTFRRAAKDRGITREELNRIIREIRQTEESTISS